MRPVEIELFSPHDGLRETSNSGSEQALNTIFHEKNFSHNPPKYNHLSWEEIFIISIAIFSLVLAFFHLLKRLLGSGIGSEVVLRLLFLPRFILE